MASLTTSDRGNFQAATTPNNWERSMKPTINLSSTCCPTASAMHIQASWAGYTAVFGSRHARGNVGWGLNANLGGREQMPIAVERQITQWMRELFEFPSTASGLFVTGSSMANLMAIWIARYQALGNPCVRLRLEGSTATGGLLLTGAHGCIDRAMDLAGWARTTCERSRSIHNNVCMWPP